jgi:hypothetical protein
MVIDDVVASCYHEVMMYPDAMPQNTIALTVRVTPEVHDVLRLFAYLNKVSINETMLQAAKKFFLGEIDERFEAFLTSFLADPRVKREDLVRMLGTIDWGSDTPVS